MQETSSCPNCSVPHHTDCWRDNGGCAVWGCSFRTRPRALCVAVGVISKTAAAGRLRKVFPFVTACVVSGFCLTKFMLERGWNAPLDPIIHSVVYKAPAPPPPPPTVEECEHGYERGHYPPVIPDPYLSKDLQVVVYRLKSTFGSPTPRSKSLFADGSLIREMRICDSDTSATLVRMLNRPSSYTTCGCLCDVPTQMGIEIRSSNQKPIDIWVDGAFNYIIVMPDREITLSMEGYSVIVSVYNKLFSKHPFHPSSG